MTISWKTTVIIDMYEPRWYRNRMHSADLITFTVCFQETDLWVGVNSCSYLPSLPADCQTIAQNLYSQLSDYLLADSGYQNALLPYLPQPSCPSIAKLMADAAMQAGVGPMAAVAGAFAQEIGKQLGQRYSLTDIIVENGGDIYLKSSQARRVSIWAGPSVLSGKLAIEIAPEQSPLGICTSSATVGHSLSFGKADAVTILCKDAALADAYATRVCNMVKRREDIEPALEYCRTQPAIEGAVIIIGDHIGFCGNMKLVKAIS